jgi:hypothetical protein
MGTTNYLLAKPSKIVPKKTQEIKPLEYKYTTTIYPLFSHLLD